MQNTYLSDTSPRDNRAAGGTWRESKSKKEIIRLRIPPLTLTPHKQQNNSARAQASSINIESCHICNVLPLRSVKIISQLRDEKCGARKIGILEHEIMGLASEPQRTLNARASGDGL